MGGDHADALGGVHRAAAPDRHQAVAPLRAILRGAFVDEVHRRIGADAIEDDRFDVRAAQRFEGGVEQAGRLHAGIGHEQRTPDA